MWPTHYCMNPWIYWSCYNCFSSQLRWPWLVSFMKFCVIPQWAEVGPPDILLSSSEWQPGLGSEISCTVAPSHLSRHPHPSPALMYMQHETTIPLQYSMFKKFLRYTGWDVGTFWPYSKTNLAGFCPMTMYLSWAKNKFVALIIQLEQTKLYRAEDVSCVAWRDNGMGRGWWRLFLPRPDNGSQLCRRVGQARPLTGHSENQLIISTVRYSRSAANKSRAQ